MIADNADRATAESSRLGRADKLREHNSRIQSRIEEQIEMIVGKRRATHGRDLRQPAAVGEEDQEHGSIGEPRHFRNERADGTPLRLVANNENIALLLIAFRWRR